MSDPTEKSHTQNRNALTLSLVISTIFGGLYLYASYTENQNISWLINEVVKAKSPLFHEEAPPKFQSISSLKLPPKRENLWINAIAKFEEEGDIEFEDEIRYGAIDTSRVLQEEFSADEGFKQRKKRKSQGYRENLEGENDSREGRQSRAREDGFEGGGRSRGYEQGESGQIERTRVKGKSRGNSGRYSKEGPDYRGDGERMGGREGQGGGRGRGGGGRGERSGGRGKRSSGRGDRGGMTSRPLGTGPRSPVDPSVAEAFTKTLKPKSFSLDGLRTADVLSPHTSLYEGMPLDDPFELEAHLCFAAFSRDFAALKYLLYDVGMSANGKNFAGGNALHCLASVIINSEKAVLVDNAARRQSRDSKDKSNPHNLEYFATWLGDFLDKYHFKNTKIFTVLARDTLEGEYETEFVDVAKWLVRAGVDVNIQDEARNTPLIIASKGGLLELVRFLLENKADATKKNKELITALHVAIAFGHVQTASLLYKAAGVDSLIETDKNGVRPRDLLENPGAISASDALKFFDVQQRKARQIKRVLHPENYPNMTAGWFAGNGGWGTERLKGFETDIGCETIDQYYAHEITAEELFNKYIARNSPVLIHGLFNDWKAISNYEYETMRNKYGDIEVMISDVPYTRKFGGDAFIESTLGAYVDQMKGRNLAGGKHPWYIFKGYRVPQDSEKPDSPARTEDTPTPKIIDKAFDRLLPIEDRGKAGADGRAKFAAAQWAVGGEGTGAPVHYHNFAWNALVYGAKKWFLYPPHERIISNRQILEFYESEMSVLEKRGAVPQTCVQMAGDVLMVPESWAHGVLNIQQSVALATETRTAIWRFSSYTNSMKAQKLIR